MNKFTKIVLINLGGFFGISLLFVPLYNEGALLVVPFVLAFFELFVAALLLIPQNTRPVAQGMLAASGLVLLIGLAVCSGMLYNG